MRLYVHLEPAEEALAWTKRLNLPPVGDASACPSVRSVLRCFLSAYASKFRLQCVPSVDSLDVFVEMNQNAASRRLLPCLDVSVAAAGNTETHSLLNSGETCDFELVAVPREPQRPVLGPEPPPSKKKCPVHAGNSSEDGREPKLRAALQLAANHMQQSKFRAARDVYSHVVLAEDALNPEALVALGDILVANGRRDEAVDKFFSKCWKAHGGVESECKAHARLAFTSALRLAECYVEMEKFWKAVEVLDELQTFVRVNSGKLVEGEGRHKAFFRDADERLWMEEQMDVLKAQALYATKRPDEQEKAISLIMHLLPDLQAPTLNLDVLLLYAKIAHDRGKKSEALSMALRVSVGKSNDRRVKKTLVAFLKDSSSMQRLQDAVPTTSASAGAAYAFIATILKDFGAVEKSILCFQQAQLSDPQSASYALNHAHALEVCCRYAEAYDVLVSFFRANRTLRVGSGKAGAAKLLAGSFAEILDHLNAWDNCHESNSTSLDESSRSGVSPVEWVSGPKGYAKVTPESGSNVATVNVAPLSLHIAQANKKTTLSEAELDLLACYFTVVKILFVSGRLSVLPPLIRVLEPLRLGRELHLTIIRNEQAYYACIAQLLSIEEALELKPPLSTPETATNDIYVCGDSHTLATAWRRIQVAKESTLLRPALVTGLKHWHLRKESTFYPKLNFWRAIANIPIRSRVIFLFGEIDCREGILYAVEKCKYESIKEGMERTISIFMEALADVVGKYEFEAYIHPVVPVLDETRALVIQYNQLFRKQVAKSTICKWLDFFDDLVCDDPPKLRPDLRLDGTHLHPAYLVNLEKALNKQCHASS
ncbi:hypothetical protein PF008_g5162 [Phytophthora fragariae]|uniref:Tetratrico peptide repeat group 5 domain-containing protein n=1 Tax=Phytophthora fragariae TaxID=53985 RepID=A0A6G0SA76_9STRA|nr:hypothetical protein PF008_g5162 [Phytophthora fragariae]